MHSQNKCRQFTIWQMAPSPAPTHLCLRGWRGSLGGKSVYIFYAMEAQPIPRPSNRCDPSWGLLAFLAEKCQTITLSNKWPPKRMPVTYRVSVVAGVTRWGWGREVVCRRVSVRGGLHTYSDGGSLLCDSCNMCLLSETGRNCSFEALADCFLIDSEVAPSLSCLFLGSSY